MPAAPLMPKATAVWLVENTTLTFDQIGEFCSLHKLEVQAIADGEVAIGINGMDPILSGQLTAEEIKRCEEDPRARLKMIKSDLPQPMVRSKGPRYTPVSKRAEKPDAVAYLIKNYPELLDAQIARLLGTTKDTIAKVRDRTHWNSANIKPINPVLAGLCKQSDLDSALKRASRRVAREAKKAGKEGVPAPEQEQDTMQDNQEPAVDLGSQEQPDINPDDVFRSMGE
ncbi:MAG TPA: DUF1013 domain-containing protein [Alphaproteobacteria bacterium]|nr:DUF1013 domain-containing protein [Alphaproteobacteria bacterium]